MKKHIHGSEIVKWLQMSTTQNHWEAGRDRSERREIRNGRGPFWLKLPPTITPAFTRTLPPWLRLGSEGSFQVGPAPRSREKGAFILSGFFHGEALIEYLAPW